MGSLNSSLYLLILCIVNLTFSYNIEWSNRFEYYDGSSRNPHVINLRGSGAGYLLVCYEETGIINTEYSGICETAHLDNTNNEITFGTKAIYQEFNASDPYEMQIYNNGWTDHFIVAYTNGPYSSQGAGKAMIGKYNPTDNTLTFGESYVFNQYLNDQSSLLELTNNSYFIVCSSVGPNNQYDTECRVGQYDTNILTILFADFSYNMTYNIHTNGMSLSRITGNGHTFVSCLGLGINSIGICFVATVEKNFANGVNSKILYGNGIVFNAEGGTNEVQIIHANASVLIICYAKTQLIGNNNSGECKFALVQQGSVSTIEIQPETFVFEYDEIASPSLFRVPANTINNKNELLGICYIDGKEGACKFGEIDLNSLTIKFDENHTNYFDDKGIGKVEARYLGNSKVVVCYVDFNGATPLFNKGVCKYGAITDEYISINKHS